ncbi:acyltransferase family protein [Streptomyces sp. NBC_01142]|uniref:acyltransferase family protein n=1 Tax=Streptomyces sp. NBC_01142 TaxID=2975865 RepID=UPI0022533CB7|nr:acyltransferase family protein [Streptomyces sp. NBC_01142]MCX4823072.1 acyltransferase family protein [Streptomyces sp. NBC_01142]
MFHPPLGFQRAPLPQAREPDPLPTTQQASAPALPAPGEKSAQKSIAKSTSRDAYFDNAKYLAIVLVAVAHAWEPVMDGSRVSRALYMLVYTFHMPAFIVISGYFSRSYSGKPHQLRRLLTGIALPYVVFEVAYSLLARWGNDDPGHPISLLDPFYLTWFLAALFIWRLTTPLWQLIRWPLPVALGLASLAVLTPKIGDDLNLQRVLQFLPFFVLGLCLKPEHFQLVRRLEVRLLALPLFAGAAVVAYWAAPRMNLGWFYHSKSGQELGVPWWSGVVMNFALFGCAVLLTAGFLAWVPRRRTWFTVLGAGTICGYVLHGFLVKGADYSGIVESYGWLRSPSGEIVVTLFMAAVVTLMCTPPVRRALRWVTEPEMAWAFKRDLTELGPRR